MSPRVNNRSGKSDALSKCEGQIREERNVCHRTRVGGGGGGSIHQEVAKIGS